ncbi:HNH endonuclease signature motif containing protein, partial [Arthrospira platensis SPKY1]|nr:HNH endonuclease signature motif containing protein [Arthrospira platensis SPKY1]
MYKLKAIEGFENYSISTDGEVINTVTNKKLKLSLKKCGYLQVGLSNKKVKAWFIVHRLVAKAFIDNPDNKEFVNHIDGDKTNNNVNNLEWVTHQENMEHAKNHNLVKRGNENPRSKLNDDLVEEICKMLQHGLRNIDISRTLNIPAYLISMIRKG